MTEDEFIAMLERPRVQGAVVAIIRDSNARGDCGPAPIKTASISREALAAARIKADRQAE